MNRSSTEVDDNTSLLPKKGGAEDEKSLDTRLIIGISFTWLASFLSAVDSTITSTISATVAAEFGSLTIISLLGSSFLISLTATQPLSGKLTDIYGRRRGFILCVILFAVGNLVCGVARTKTILILGRVLAGIGGGGCNSITTFIGSDLVPLRRRGMWHGFGMITYSTGLGLGGIIGGSINQYLGWRWAFLILIPFSIVSCVGAYIFLPTLTKPSTTANPLSRIDFLGSILLASALIAFLIGVNHEGPSNLLLKITLPLAAFLFILFALVELHYASEPIIPIGLLKYRTVTAACLTGWFNSMGIYTLMFYIPLYFQLRGYSTSLTGVLLLPEPIGAALGSFVSGALMRYTGSYAQLKPVVLIFFIFGTVGYAMLGMESKIWLAEVFLVINGVGLGGSLTVIMLALLSAVEHEHQAVVTSMLYAFRSTGATIGVAVSGTPFRALLKNRMNGEIGKIGDGLTEKEKESYMSALHGTFILAAGFAGAAFVCGLCTENFQLRTTFEKDKGIDVLEEEENSHVE